MFQAPRPISHAPVHSNFTPAATPTLPFTPNYAFAGGQTSGATNPPPANVATHHHIMAVPITNTHRPIAMHAHRGSGSGHSGPNSATSFTRPTPHFIQRMQQQAAGEQGGAHSPSASPAISSSHSASGSPAIASAVPSGGSSSLGLGFSLNTPSPPLPTPVSVPPASDTPGSPMMSPIHTQERDRRDSVNESEVASEQLQGILWRNAAQNRTGVRHPQTPLVSSHGLASPVRSTMSPASGLPASALSSLGASAHPSTPPSGNFTRAIPISKPRGSAAHGGPSIPWQLSILNQMQQAGEAGEHVTQGGSREGSRRGSATGSLPQSAFVGSSSPLGTSLGSSYILSMTPPTRAGNPLDRDSCFSPAQQAEYLVKHAADGMSSHLPMMAALPAFPNKANVGAYATLHQSPIVRSTLAQSLALRQTMQPGGHLSHKFASPQLQYQQQQQASAGRPMARADHPQASPHQTEEDGHHWPKLSCTL